MLFDSVFNSFLYFRLGANKPGNLNDFNYLKSDDPERKTVVCNNSTIPKKTDSYIRIYCISDTHERHETLEDIPETMECDIFIHGGDIFMTSRMLSLEVISLNVPILCFSMNIVEVYLKLSCLVIIDRVV